MKTAKHIISLFDQYKSARTTWEDTWQEVADNLVGRREFKTDVYQGGRQRLAKIYDGTGMRSAQLFASAISSLLTNPSTKWFNLAFADKAMRENYDFQLWLQEVEENIRFAFSRPEARFQPQIHETYTDLINFGTGGLAVLEDPADGTYFVSRNLNELYLAENAKGDVDTVFRSFELTARQVEQEYPGESEEAKRLVERGQPEQKMKIINAIMPNGDFSKGAIGPRGMAYSSIHVLNSEGNAQILREGGFYEKPIMTPRWEKDSGEIYGRGPGIQALPDAKMLNQMNKTMLKAGQKSVDPPLMTSDRGVFGNVRTHAGGNTIVRLDGSGRFPIQELNSPKNFQIGLELIKAKQEDVEGAYHADILEVFRQPHMTATQVIEISNQVQRILAPVLGRQQNELLEPMVARVLMLEFRAGRLPTPPAGLENPIVNVEYQSPVARAQQASEKQALLEAAGSIIQLATANPDVLDNLDMDVLTRHIWELGGLPVEVVRSVDDVGAIRQQRAKEQAAQQKAAMMMQVAELAVKAGGGEAPAEAV
jgi:hypothetical protein